MTPRVSIGEFARAAHLSVRTLRHYHEVGLLEPSEIDSGSGYRYYSYEQIPTAQVIRRLRGLEMPVADVKAILAAADSEARYRLIVEHLDRLEAELAHTQAAVGELRDLLQQPQASHPVEHRTLAPTAAVGIHDVVDREDILAWWQGALGELHATVRAQGLRPTGAAGGLYACEIFEHDRGQATVFVPVDGSARAIGRVEPLIVPGAELAVLRHHGPFTNIDLTYGELGAYVIKHEISVQGPLRENYLCGFPDTQDAQAWETEIGWPIFRSDKGTQEPHPG
jgi:DNA-binding transcriptional MerR regulator/effector-binding domain-containing protein